MEKQIEKKEGFGRIKVEPPIAIAEEFKHLAERESLSQTDFFIKVFTFYMTSRIKKD